MPIEQLGMQAAQSAAGGILGLALGGLQNQQQLWQQKQLMYQQLQGNQLMMDYQQKKQLEMWKATNYGAQVDQLKQAGLNPGLLYGMSGGGGATTGTANAGVSGGQAQTGGAIAMAQTSMQMGLMKAQKENIEADTNLKTVDANKRRGIDTDVAKQELINKDAQEKLTRMQTAWQEIQNSISRQTMVDAMKTIENNVKQQEEQIKGMKLQNQLSESQMNDKIKLMRYEAIGAALENTLKHAHTENIKQDTKVKLEQITQMIKNNIREWDKIGIEKQRVDIWQSELQGLYDDLPNPLKEILGPLLIVPSIGKGVTKPITGFHQR